MSRDPKLTTTSYAILGLLAVRPWTPYEIAQQMRRSLGRFWPRAESKIYEEPKKLVALGFAEAEPDHTGNRPRTIYTITEAGREALADWLAEPGTGPVLEFEGLVKVFFAEQGSVADTLATLGALRAWAEEQAASDAAIARSYLAGEGPFPERGAQLVLVGRFLSDFGEMVQRWAEWATDVVQTWPDDGNPPPPAWDALHVVVERGTPGDGSVPEPETSD